MEAFFEIGKELGELRGRVAALEAGQGGDGAGQRSRLKLPSCDSVREAIEALDKSIENLQEEISKAPPPPKPADAAKIKKMEIARNQLQTQLDSLGGCI